MKFDCCYSCPDYHHKGAFGNPRYVPMCKGKELPYRINSRNHAVMEQQKIHCAKLNK